MEKLVEEVNMQFSLGYRTAYPTLICRRNNSLYGLKQTSRQWFFNLASSLLETVYSRFLYDHSLLTMHTATGFVVVFILLDDILLPKD